MFLRPPPPNQRKHPLLKLPVFTVFTPFRNIYTDTMSKELTGLIEVKSRVNWEKVANDLRDKRKRVKMSFEIERKIQCTLTSIPPRQ